MRKKKRAEKQKTERDNLGEDGWFSDVGGEDDLHSLRGSDDDNVDHMVWNEDMDRQDVDLCIGMKFPTREKYREALKDWAVRRGWDLTFVKNEKTKITAICKNGCDWRIHASPMMRNTTFQIKSIKGQHNCAHRRENKQANYKYIGKRIQDFVKDNPSKDLQSLKNKIRRDIQVDVSLFKVYRAKKYALELMKGDVKQQYARLYDYCATVCKHNSGSSMILKVDRDLNPPVLQRMYACFGGLKEGRDGNDNIYSIAMAYVEIEKYDSWEWFLNLLLRDIGSHDERGWTFISDRQKGLIEAVTQLAPRAEHRFCLRHMYNNFKGKFKGQELKNLFWKAASTYNIKEYLRTMKEIERVHKKRGQEQTAIEWLAEIPVHHWARCFFPVTTHCDVVVNNMMVAIEYHRQNLENFVHVCFKKETYMRVYSHMIKPVPGMHDHEESPLGPVAPPHVIKRAGRPKKARRRDANDIKEPSRISRRGLTHTCGICFRQGHNKRSCTNPPHPNSRFRRVIHLGMHKQVMMHPKFTRSCCRGATYCNATEESFPYAEMHTQLFSSVSHCNATEQSFPSTEMHTQSSSSVSPSNATAEVHTNVT
ncbi:UNVERIFIED_CONTAM: hypothetical protein Slati_2348500 [Sesamum latifolium]|uniref:Transposase MuDR plant domain-containing protein n=1 Tax=Sesamum latifolium TaxID=2727402 RepID=A0AAW2WA76_9LAMI